MAGDERDRDDHDDAYVQALSGQPLPTPEQTRNFAEYVSGALRFAPRPGAQPTAAALPPAADDDDEWAAKSRHLEQAALARQKRLAADAPPSAGDPAAPPVYRRDPVESDEEFCRQFAAYY